MQLTFLAASDGTPLAKRFVHESNGTLTTHQYPNVRDFTSFERSPESLDEAYEMLVAHAEAGHCLLKGNLDRPIEGESRAGRTNPVALTDYVLLDLDFEDGFKSIDDFLAQISLDDVSYILHHSSSAGVRYKPGLRAHILIQLAEPQAPAMLKSWLQHLNLTTPNLRPSLNTTKMGLSWPLDVTTCQSDKLIYIADPSTEGIDDPLAGSRFELHHRTHAKASLDLRALEPAVTANAQQELIAALRSDLGLPKKALRFSKGGEGILLNPDQAVVTGVREERGFVYLNLNGGDSWGYYYPESSPTTLYSFKGDPPVRLADIAPDFFEQVRPRDPIDLVTPGTTRFVARDNATDTYYCCIYHPDTNHVELNKAQRKHLQDFLGMTGEDMPDIVPEWKLTFDPRTTKTYDPEIRWINTFRPTRYMLIDPTQVDAIIGPTITKILRSLCGTDEVQEYFLNWLAFVFQTRNKPKTAILFQGEEGTGKGLLYARILKPLFGAQHTIELKAEALREPYNGWIKHKLIVCLDEFEVTEKDTKVITDLRNHITEDTVALREMRKETREVDSFTGFILNTNTHGAMPITSSDRRYTIAPRQEHRLEMTDEEVNGIEAELEGFAAYLLTLKVDTNRVRVPLDTEAKSDMRHSAETHGERIIRAFREGDLQFFIDMMEVNAPLLDIRVTAYNGLVREWYQKRHEPIPITIDQFRMVYNTLTNSTRGITKGFAQKRFQERLRPLEPGNRTKLMHFQEPTHPPVEASTASSNPKVAMFPQRANSA